MYPLLQQAANAGNQSGKAGYKAPFFIALMSEFTTFDEPPATGTNPGDTFTATGNHAFASGDGWYRFMGFFKKGLKLDGKQGGEVGFPTREWTLEAFIVGDDAATKERMHSLDGKTVSVIFGDPDCNSTRKQQIGCPCNPAVVSFDFESGDLDGGMKGFKMTITTKCPPFDYEGTMTYAT